MKKLYRKGTVHPSPPLISDHLSFLPAAILTLAVALSQEDKEVLAYLISCSSGEFSGKFSGNRRITHKSTTPNSAPPTSTSIAAASAAMGGGGGGGAALSGNRRAIHFKSETPNSVSENSGVGCSKGTTEAHGGVFGGGDDGGAEHVLSGEFSGNRRTSHNKSATPNWVSENSGGGCSKGVAAVSGGADHVTSFNCYCFSCYTSYWVKWNSSPNIQLIHEILDAYEDGLQSKKEKSKKERRNKKGSSLKQNGSSLSKNGSSNGDVGELKKSSSESSLNKNGSGSGHTDPVEETSGSSSGGGDGGDEEETVGGGGGGTEKGSVRKFVSFLGERIWSVWT